VLDSISQWNSCCHQALVFDLNLLIGGDLGLVDKGDHRLSGIAEGIIELRQLGLLERMVGRQIHGCFLATKMWKILIKMQHLHCMRIKSEKG